MQSLIFLIISFLIFTCNSANAQGSSWSQPINLTNSNDPMLVNEAVRVDSLSALGIDNNGNAVVLLNMPQYACKGAHFQSSVSLPNGQAPQAPIQISNCKTGSVCSNIKGASSAIAVDSSGNSVAIWLEDNERDRTVILKASTMPQGGSWSVPVILDTTGEKEANDEEGRFRGSLSSLVLEVHSSGNATAAWVREKREKDSSYISVQTARLPFGGTWTPLKKIVSYKNENFPQHTIYQLALAVEEEHAALTWVHRELPGNKDSEKPNAHTEYIEGSLRKANKWSRLSKIVCVKSCDPLGSLFNYDVAMDSSGTPLALFGEIDFQGVWFVYAAQYQGQQNENKEFDNLWKTPMLVSKNRDHFASHAREFNSYPPGQAGSVIFDADDNAIAIWSGVVKRHKIIRASTFKKETCKWSKPVNISKSDIHSFSPQIAKTSDKSAVKKVVAVWLVSENYSDLSGYLVQASTMAQGFDWSFPANISPIGQAVKFPQIKMSSNGHAIVVWNNQTAGTIQGVISAPGLWTDLETISSAGASFPKVVMDVAGNAIAIWNRTTKVNDFIEFARLPILSNWTSPVNLSGTGRGSAANVCINSAGNGAFIWSHSNGNMKCINASCLPCRDVLQGPACLSDSSGNSGCPSIVVDANGNSFAVWQYFDGKNNIIQAATRQGKQPWTTAVRISSSGQNADSPQLVVDGVGNAIAVWERFDGSNSIIQSSVLKLGENWTEPQDLSPLSVDSGSPSLAVSPLGSAIAVWVQAKDGPIQAAALPSTDFPVWMPPVDIAPGIPSFSYLTPQVKIDQQGNAVALWVFDNAIQAGYKRADEFSWNVQTLTPIHKPSLAALNPQLAMNDAGHAIGIWERSDGSFSRIECAYVAGNGQWSIPTFISEEEENAFNPSAAISLGGDVVAVWQNAATNTIQSSKAYGLFHFSTMLPPLPPRGFLGDAYDNYAFTQFNRVHKLAWQPSPDGAVYGYNIYRNGILLTTVYAPGPYTYFDWNRQGNVDIYEISAISPYGESRKVTVELNSLLNKGRK